MSESSLPAFLFIWMVIVAALTMGRFWHRTSGVGLVLAYVLNLWMIHWVAPALYLLPAHRGYHPAIVEAGVQQSLYGIAAFAFASLILTPFLLNFGILPRVVRRPHVDEHLPLAYVILGAASFVLLSLGVGALPSATAILSTGQQLVVVGLALCCWRAWRERSTWKLLLWLGAACLLPFITIVTQGFIGYGAVAALTVFIFVSRFVRARPVVIAGALLLGYVAMSLFVTYMRDRAEIRATVWGGQPMEARLNRVEATLERFEWFDLARPEHRMAVDGRLNQSALVGLAVMRAADTGIYARGETLWDALISVVPRAVWPEKPIEAGSGNLVSQYTGLRFATGTSVGIGQVMEFYINFGTLGVIVGFLFMGVLVTTLDIAASYRLAAGDLRGFVFWFLPGISMLQVGGSLVEVTAGAAASIMMAALANALVDHLHRRGAAMPVARPAAFTLGGQR